MNQAKAHPSLSNRVRAFSAVIAVVCLAAVGLQLAISLPAYFEKGRSLGGSLVEYFSYFTIQSNLLVALATGSVAVGGFSDRFFTRPKVLSAIVVYITIVCVVYNAVLRAIFHPVGWGRVADELLHVADPLLYIIFWLMVVPKNGIAYKSTLSWLLYPLVYIVYILIRGAFTARYPYFFLDTVKYGYPKVAVHIAILVVVFWMFCLLYAFIAQRISARKSA
ncbi:hypothetical protein D0C36_06020 [Mucilaginibacter conchicola]|uniref:FAR-17a/AIG1-like protein n=1 Tax=Mucilaginibacter conchicola TaxID=2303333 RepID=A0A372NYH6_9SPHI|nr:Pr6Pr family membrane protein [Mucilaginibacter conchicola]RFZ95082.1 hypothetical protein D0C36_06020 [Mucilaginibacter conchicola]